jgi:hypothetical protein
MQRRTVSSLLITLVAYLTLQLGSMLLSSPAALAASAPTASTTPAKWNAAILPGSLNGSLTANNVSTPGRNVALTTTSIYEKTTDASVMYAQGSQAARGAAGLLILDWGQPYYLGNGLYGTYHFGGRAVSDDAILQATKSFIQGVWANRSSSTNLAVAIGESNYASSYAMPLSTTAWYNNGLQWGNLVNKAQSFVAANHYDKVIGIYGAGDLETAWSSFTLASNLVNGYNKASSRLYFDFGDAAPGYWTNEQLWYVAYGAKNNLPIPEIYYNANATTWGMLSRWACTYKGAPMAVRGIMTTTIGNSASQSWNAMYQALASNSCTAKTLPQMLFSTKIA